MTADIPWWQIWNDGTVPKLAQSIFDDKRFDLLPILADALDEAGYPDQELPGQFRLLMSDATAVRLLAPIIGGELAESVKSIEERVREANETVSIGEGYESVMEAASIFVETGRQIGPTQSFDDWRESVIEDYSGAFWGWYEIITATQVEDKKASVFYCCDHEGRTDFNDWQE